MSRQNQRMNAEGGPGQRRCTGCSAPLAADNTAPMCSRCVREQRDQLRTPPVNLPDEFWDTDDFRAAFDSENIGRVCKVYRNHPTHVKLYGKPLNQETLGRWLGLTQAQVSKLENGRPEPNLEILRGYVKILHIPQRCLWFDLPGQSRLSARASSPNGHSRSALTVPQISWPDSSGMIVGGLLSDPFTFEDHCAVPASALASTVRETTADLMAMDFKRGGGHTRRMLSHYFCEEVAPLLSWQYPSDRLRSDVFSAVAETLQLLGWSAYDAGSHDTARQNFGRALRVAQEANDAAMSGRILSNLSHQSNFLGRFEEALQFARQAQDVAQEKATNTVSSMFVAMEARALANLGDQHEAAKVLHHAEKLHDGRDPERDPTWISYFNSQEIASEAAHCFRDLGQADKCIEFAELSMDPMHTPPRTLGFMRMVAASGALAGGDAERASSLATEAIQLGVSLRSARYVKYLTDFYVSLNTRDAALAQQISNQLQSHYPALMLSSS